MNGVLNDLTGKRFGSLVAISHHRYRNATRWLCHCDCGAEVTRYLGALTRGEATHCGCKRGETSRTHGMTSTRLYLAWQNMKARCNNSRTKHYASYGGRGIRVCDRWAYSFENFLADMGESPTPMHTLDRIDNNGNYCPENCRWATRSEQQANRRPVRLLTFNGRTQCAAAWARELGAPKGLIYKRLRLGWSVERAVTTPPLAQYQRT